MSKLINVTHLFPVEPHIRNSPVKVVTENVEDILSHHKCSLYLQLWYEDLYSEENVKKCYNIFSLVTQKANLFNTYHEKREIIYHDFSYSKYYEKPGTSVIKRKFIVLDLYGSFISRFCVSNKTYFTLRELLTDDNKYKTFLDYWENLENYETKRNILSQVLCKDVVDKILTMY